MKHPSDHFAPRPFPGLPPAEEFVAPPKITRDSQPTISVTVWRCSSCGKWSHAKRRPPGHYRFISDHDLDRAYAGAIRSHRFGRSGWEVPCGPFEKWEAWKVETS